MTVGVVVDSFAPMHRWLASFLALLFTVGAVVVPSLHRHVPECCVEQGGASSEAALSAGCGGHEGILPPPEHRASGGGTIRPISNDAALVADASAGVWRAAPPGDCPVCLVAKLPMLAADPFVAPAADGAVPAPLLDGYDIPALVRLRLAGAPRGPPSCC